MSLHRRPDYKTRASNDARALLNMGRETPKENIRAEGLGGVTFYRHEVKPGTVSPEPSEEARLAVRGMLAKHRNFGSNEVLTIGLSPDVVPLDRIMEMGRLVSQPRKGFLVVDSLLSVESNRHTAQAMTQIQRFKRRASGLFFMEGQDPSDSQKKRLDDLQETVSRLAVPRMNIVLPTAYGDHDHSQDTNELVLSEVFNMLGLADDQPADSAPSSFPTRQS